jgi:uncharacterized membrane protein YraQ (UPF0718 family)
MLKKIKEKISGNWLFLIITILVYIIVILFFQESFYKSMSIFGKTLIDILPIMLLVFGFMFVFNFFLTPEKISQIFGKSAGFKAWTFAVALGVLSSGPIYMWYPMLANLRKQGVRDCFIIAFLYNRAIKIPFMPMTIFYFGWPFLILMTVFMILFSIINGYIGEKILKFKLRS